MSNEQLELIKASIKAVADYPKPGIMFRDVTSLMQDPEAFSLVINHFKEKYQDQGFTKIIGTEARGFIFGAPLAYAMGVSFVPVRKPGKLPRETIAESYALEYGTDTLEIHTDALEAGDKVLLVDDLLATGGTIEATAKLAERLGAKAEHAAFVVSLPDLGGEARLKNLNIDVHAIVEYEGD
ncbi:adenine phosphoribosyltransferase [Flocculibacter collagenilyticus]|uniref:adenine phosphoribosyltransferase n=1 Tax=Flocculibacter collagenilyticus TaxID=2744479 RepID=UPI0018F78E14|nr:adenine phosphoribosyltransferase [Flocculibacter collagenilyticus]